MSTLKSLHFKKNKNYFKRLQGLYKVHSKSDNSNHDFILEEQAEDTSRKDKYSKCEYLLDLNIFFF